MAGRRSTLARTAMLLVGAVPAAMALALIQPSAATAAPGRAPAAAGQVAPAQRGTVTEVTAAGLVVCPTPYLSTGFGPVGQCTLLSGSTGQVGFFSPLTRTFSPSRDPLPVFNTSCRPTTSSIRGCIPLQTGFGPVLFATQYSGGQGRWGNYSLITGAFAPTSGWMPVV